MNSTDYLREIQRIEKRKLETGKFFVHAKGPGSKSKPAVPGLITRFLNGSGIFLISIGRRLQELSMNRNLNTDQIN